MKTAGDIISTLFDERFVKKAQGYSKLFDSWEDITSKNGINAAGHSRVKNLDNGILLIEIDHPGWKQILQIKQSKLLDDFRYRFPELNISGISLILGSGSPEAENGSVSEVRKETVKQPAEVQPVVKEMPPVKGFDAINDEEFKETLKRLGQSVASRNAAK